MEAVEDNTEKKTTTYEEQDHNKAAEYKYEIADIPRESIAYVDETGIDCYFYREYGYGPRGRPVHDRIRGSKYMRSGIVAAQMENEIITPYQYIGTMNQALQKKLCKRGQAMVKETEADQGAARTGHSPG